MATAIANGAGRGLPLEPSQPQQREAIGLPPKSYADAAEEAIHDNNGDTKNPNGILSTPMPTPYTNTSAMDEGILDRAGDKPPVPNKKAHLKQPSSSRPENKANGVKADIANLYGEGVLEKEYEVDGQVLVSTRAPKGYHSALAQANEEHKPAMTNKTVAMQQKDELVSGRTAGARWGRSA